MKLFPKLENNLLSRAATLALGVAMGGLLILASACSTADGKPVFTEGKAFAGGQDDDPATGRIVSAKTLNDGHDAYMQYCYACHGMNGDGKGPSSYGLRPPPRDFTKGIFKFARMRSGEDLPTDDDLVRIVRGGLHGTAMLPWDDIPVSELEKILQYVKTFAPQKWEKVKKNGDHVKTIEEFAPTEDPWAGKEDEAIKTGKELYHLRAECVTCHPAYGTKDDLYALSVAAAKRDPDKFKVISGFRDDPYGSVAKDSAEYGVKILPPDFTYIPVRSVRPGITQMEDLYRVISYGVFPIMPAWRGAGLSEKEIWAIAHYVRSLINIQGTAEADALKTKLYASTHFVVPAPAPETVPASTTTTTDVDAGAPAADDAGAPKKDDKGKDDKSKGDKKK